MAKHPDYPAPAADPDGLPKNYEGLAREQFWQAYWDRCGVYKFEPAHADGSLRTRDEIFSIDTPPPTVSGALHIGHVYSYTQTDMNARYQRMRGKHVFYPFGFDDNGLPTERLVEKVKNIRAHEVSREEFIRMCQEVVEPAEAEFIALWRSLAISCDWEQFYTTIDDRSRAISQSSFIDLYNRGYVYRKVAPTQWDWVNQTAIAQAEIEDREVPGHFYDIRFGWADGPGEPVQGHLTIATTRPELIPACVAVFAHPDDARYQHLFGKVAVTPLFEVEVPILPSEKANPEKGTGILMCCTFGDMDDVEHWQQFNLPARVIIGKDGRLTEFGGRYWDAKGFKAELHTAPLSQAAQIELSTQWPCRTPSKANRISKDLMGLKVKQAREQIRELLRESGDLLSVKDIMHTVRHAERGDVPVEILVTPQWYVNILAHKDALLERGREINWHPEYMRKRYEQWVDGLNTDWCISRQRYNGVPFPVWYMRTEPELRAFVEFTDLLPPGLREQAISEAAQTDEPLFTLFNAIDGLYLGAAVAKEKSTLANLGYAKQDLQEGYDYIKAIRETGFPEYFFKRTELICNSQELLPVNPLNGNPTELIEQVQSDLHAVFDGDQIARINQAYGFLSVTPDPDVMDTWATSSTTPYLNTHLLLARGEDGSIPTTDRHNQLFPFDMRPQAHDIIRTWAFYTIAKAYFHFGTIPWQDIVISGHAQDAGGKKISKSKGHVVTPAEMVDKYTADGLRYWSGSARLGADTLYDERNLTEGRKLINKIFNATKFALRHLLDFDPTVPPATVVEMGRMDIMDEPQTGYVQPPEEFPYELITYPTDLWLIGRLNDTIERATRASDAFEFGEAKQAVEDFFWADLCDNYLELSKGRLYGEPLAVDAHNGWNEDARYTAEQLRASAQATLHLALSAVLRMFAPVLPHITEECWSWHFARFSDRRSVHEEPWPVPIPVGAHGSAPGQPDRDDSRAHFHAPLLLLATVAAVRKWKSEQNVSVKKPLASIRIYLTEHAGRHESGAYLIDSNHLHAVLGDLLATCNAQQAFMDDDNPPAGAVTTERNPVAVLCELAPDAA